MDVMAAGFGGVVIVVDDGTLIPAARAEATVVVNTVAAPAMSAPAANPARMMRADLLVTGSPYG
ncbi:hypothetical protein [Saccharothrix stipae]